MALNLEGAPISGNIKNNIFYSTSTAVPTVSLYNSSVIGGVTLEMDYNLIAPERNGFIKGVTYAFYDMLAAWVSATRYDTHSKTSAPLFVSTVTPDFHLQSSSPAINAGTSVGLMRDFSGNLVPYGSAPDIGAHEYTSFNSPINIPVPPNTTPLKMPVPPTNLKISP